ncbi:hypothetical protein D6779_02040 [Candidatus Parcubacteria bacterium]|nr:MAG: hypothetical protein D6779_02040 [Candidatus Parcubacteria bacterium]
MSPDIGINTEEAENTKRMIQEQSEVAKDAIRRVKNSPNMLSSWRGNRRRRFDEAVVADMQKLEQAITLVDQAAQQIQEAIQRFVEADR